MLDNFCSNCGHDNCDGACGMYDVKDKPKKSTYRWLDSYEQIMRDEIERLYSRENR